MITKERKAEIESRNKDIFELYKSGISVKNIAKKYNLSYSHIRNIIRSLNKDKVKSNKIDYKIYDYYDLSILSNDEIEILKRKNRGDTFKEISKDFSVTSSAIRLRAFAAIEKLQNKELTRNKYKKSYYRSHIEQERSRKRRRTDAENLEKQKQIEKEQKEICELRAQGLSVLEIASLKNRSINTVYSVLRRNNLDEYIKKYKNKKLTDK